VEIVQRFKFDTVTDVDKTIEQDDKTIEQKEDPDRTLSQS
jgi:hypothetical protein